MNCIFYVRPSCYAKQKGKSNTYFHPHKLWHFFITTFYFLTLRSQSHISHACIKNMALRPTNKNIKKEVRLRRILNVFRISGAHHAEKFLYQRDKIPFASHIIFLFLLPIIRCKFFVSLFHVLLVYIYFLSAYDFI